MMKSPLTLSALGLYLVLCSLESPKTLPEIAGMSKDSLESTEQYMHELQSKGYVKTYYGAHESAQAQA